MTTQTVEQTVSELYDCGAFTWDADIAVTCELDKPDLSVGYRGGWDIVSHRVVHYYRWSQCEDIEGYTPEQMEEKHPGIKAEVDGLAGDYVVSRKGLEEFTAAAYEQQEAEAEADREAYCEALEEYHRNGG